MTLFFTRFTLTFHGRLGKINGSTFAGLLKVCDFATHGSDRALMFKAHQILVKSPVVFDRGPNLTPTTEILSADLTNATV